MSPVGTVFGLAFYDSGDAQISGSGGVGTNSLTGIVADGAVHGLVTDCGGVAQVTVHYEAGPGVA